MLTYGRREESLVLSDRVPGGGRIYQYLPDLNIFGVIDFETCGFV